MCVKGGVSQLHGDSTRSCTGGQIPGFLLRKPPRLTGQLLSLFRVVFVFSVCSPSSVWDSSWARSEDRPQQLVLRPHRAEERCSQQGMAQLMSST